VTRLFDRGQRVPADVLARAGLPRREKVLAGATAADGTWLLGTRDALVLVPPATEGPSVRIPWERVENAEWERDDERLAVVEVGEFGRPRPVHTFTLTDPGPLLPMVRERVTASVLLQRRVNVRGRTGLRVVARRAPRGSGEIVWAYELDPGIDPEDPEVAEAAAAGLRAAEDELGDAAGAT
jgi:hypothetical protein